MQGRPGARAFVVAATLVASACSGGAAEQAEPTASIENTETIETTEITAPRTDPIGGENASARPGDAEVRRELGLRLRPESDIETNLLPPVEVHDVGQDRMVNFKNIFPADRPVLLWMWAPY